MDVILVSAAGVAMVVGALCLMLRIDRAARLVGLESGVRGD
jgi:hypothetical protein